MRGILLLALAFACAGYAAAPADAVRPVGYPETLTTEHFQIHYTGELVTPPNTDRIIHQQAGELAAHAEAAYATVVTSWGYPAPPDDGDGRIDVWVQDLSALGVIGLAFDDPAGDWISINTADVESRHVIAHELMHLIQFGIWRPADSWLLEGTAEWTGFALNDYATYGSAIGQTFAAPDLSLDCVGDACGNDLYETGGYSRWTFFQYLSERFGNLLLRDVLSTGATLADPTRTGAQLLGSTLAAKGTTLGDVFNDYSAVLAAGTFAPSAIKGLPPQPYASLETGAAAGALPALHVPVNHLASRYLRFSRGASSATCYAATLSVTVALPPGIGSKPSFYSTPFGATAIPLAVNGNTASISVPWDTCSTGAHAYLALPNPSLTADARVFGVSSSLAVDTSTTVSPSAPPTPLYTGPTVAAPLMEAAPSILVYGAELVRVPAKTRVARLIVFSRGPGLVRAAVGGTVIGVGRLRVGNNDLRFRLPAAVVRSLRSTAGRRASSTRLTLTSLSAQGAVGKTVARKVVVVTPKRKAKR